jgi:MFS transporter, DHA1 family, multidrug resistance protein
VLNFFSYWLILSLVCITPLANDMFIPAFPDIKKFFITDHLGWVISFYLLALSIGQPICGPLSDRFGRKPILIVGFSIFILGSILTLTTKLYFCFLIGRFIQGLGSSCAIISVFAIIKDTREDKAFIQAMSIIMTIIGFFPTIAPLLGSFVTVHFGWKGSFYVLLGLAVVYLLLIVFTFNETNKNTNKYPLQLRSILNNYLKLLKCKPFFLICLTSGCCYGVLFTYLSVAPFYLIVKFKFSVLNFGWAIFFLGLILFFTSLSTPKLLSKFTNFTILKIGSLFFFIGSLMMLVLNIYFEASAYTFLFPMCFIMLGFSLLRSTCSITAMKLSPKELSGSSAAAINFCTFFCGSICSSLSAFLLGGPLFLAIFILFISLILLKTTSLIKKLSIS